MISSLRRKRPTTAVRSMPARRAVSLIGVGLLLAASLTPRVGRAQTPTRSVSEATPTQGTTAPAPLDSAGVYTPQITRTLHFKKPPNVPAPPALPNPNLGTKGPGNETTGPSLAPSRTDPALRPVTLQAQPRNVAPTPADETESYQVQLEPPGPLRLFRLESEKALQERIRQEVRDRTPPGMTPERTVFPDEPVISRQRYAGRSFPPGQLVAEPSYLCYGRLYFEQKNLERYGWDLGPFTPLVSAAGFYWDLATLPYHMGTAPCRWYECNTGYCLPGDPVPLLLYPPELSLTGLIAEAGVVTALFAIFP